MHIFNKISSALYGVYTAFIVVLLIAYLFGVLNLNLILSVAGTVSVSMLLISLPLEILGDLLEKQKPIMDKKGKTILVACLLNNMLCLIWGIASSSLVYDLLVGIPLTIGGIIGVFISAEALRMNKLLRQEADLK
jgi:hypothetical protein